MSEKIIITIASLISIVLTIVYIMAFTGKL